MWMKGFDLYLIKSNKQIPIDPNESWPRNMLIMQVQERIQIKFKSSYKFFK
jgi:hypothetical protein